MDGTLPKTSKTNSSPLKRDHPKKETRKYSKTTIFVGGELLNFGVVYVFFFAPESTHVNQSRPKNDIGCHWTGHKIATVFLTAQSTLQ